MEKFKSTLIKLKSKNKKIVAYGASAKSGTISRCANIGSDLIDFYIDDSPSNKVCTHQFIIFLFCQRRKDLKKLIIF